MDLALPSAPSSGGCLILVTFHPWAFTNGALIGFKHVEFCICKKSQVRTLPKREQ